MTFGRPPSARALVRNPRTTFLHPQEEGDLRSGRISPRLIALLSLITQRHRIALFAPQSDHHAGTNHEAGRAAAIARVDGETCDADAHPRTGHCYSTQAWALRNAMKPSAKDKAQDSDDDEPKSADAEAEVSTDE